MKTLISIILCLLLILLVIVLVLRKAEPTRIQEAVKHTSFTYYITLSKGGIIKGMSLESGEWLPHYETLQTGDTVKLWRQDKCLLSERNNLINAVTGVVEYENVADVWEVK